jgi:hypothetical protein
MQNNKALDIAPKPVYGDSNDSTYVSYNQSIICGYAFKVINNSPVNIYVNSKLVNATLAHEKVKP